MFESFKLVQRNLDKIYYDKATYGLQLRKVRRLSLLDEFERP